MANQKVKDTSQGRKQQAADQIHFTLHVTATNLPLNHKDFKIKLAMDFGPKFSADLVTRNPGPNFSARRVRSILNFISDKVIRKVIEFIYFKNVYVVDGKPATLISNEIINRIYADRARYRKKYPLESKPELKEEEETIARIVNELIDQERRQIPIEEREVESVKFEQLSPGKLAVSVQKIVNGDMPPP